MKQKTTSAAMQDISPVAIIERLGGHGGMDYYDFGLARGLLAAGCPVSLYTCDETRNPQLPGLRFCPVFRQIFGDGSRAMRTWRYVRGVIEALAKTVMQKEKICHLHLFHGSFDELALVVLCKLFGRRVIITVHDVESFFSSGASRNAIGGIYRLADRIIVHNQISRREVIEKLDIPGARVTVVASGNYLSEAPQEVPAAEARRALGIQEGSVILFFGHIRETKGLDVLIGAMPAVARKFPAVRLVIAGRPLRKDFTAYEKMIDGLGIRDRCLLHTDFIPNERLPLYFAAADVVVLPYRRIYQSAVILMAMGFRRAVVVSDIPGMREMVTDGENGYVFEDGSTASLSEQLIRALQDDSGREQIASSALEYIRKNNDWNEIGKQTLLLYQSALSRRTSNSLPS